MGSKWSSFTISLSIPILIHSIHWHTASIMMSSDDIIACYHQESPVINLRLGSSGCGFCCDLTKGAKALLSRRFDEILTFAKMHIPCSSGML